MLPSFVPDPTGELKHVVKTDFALFTKYQSGFPMFPAPILAFKCCFSQILFWSFPSIAKLKLRDWRAFHLTELVGLKFTDTTNPEDVNVTSTSNAVAQHAISAVSPCPHRLEDVNMTVTSNLEDVDMISTTNALTQHVIPGLFHIIHRA
jgi:hypothetical protein